MTKKKKTNISLFTRPSIFYGVLTVASIIILILLVFTQLNGTIKPTVDLAEYFVTPSPAKSRESVGEFSGDIKEYKDGTFAFNFKYPAELEVEVLDVGSESLDNFYETYLQLTLNDPRTGFQLTNIQVLERDAFLNFSNPGPDKVMTLRQHAKLVGLEKEYLTVMPHVGGKDAYLYSVRRESPFARLVIDINTAIIIVQGTSHSFSILDLPWWEQVIFDSFRVN